jgi:hypothetical protein
MGKPHNYQDLTGKVFGDLTVLERVGVDSGGHTLWRCRRASGEVIRNGSYVVKQAQPKKPLNAERVVWRSMLTRCSNGYVDYEGRGIQVCDRWRENFENFIEDMGPRPGRGWSLDRIDVDGDYEPGNCRWATLKEQARNRQRVPKLTLDGETLTVAEWAEKLGMKRHNIYNRMKAGLPVEEVLDPRRRPYGRSGRPRKATRKAEMHGMTKTPTYAAWQAMVARCTRPGHPAWKNYGGRGIKVCPPWEGSFKTFLSDMGERLGGMSLERVDNERGYEPGNCRWVGRREQNRNRRGNRVLSYGGREQLLVEWSEQTGLPSERIRSRLRTGWTVGEALGFEVRIRGRCLPKVVDTGPTLPEVDGELVAGALGAKKL